MYQAIVVAKRQEDIRVEDIIGEYKNLLEALNQAREACKNSGGDGYYAILKTDIQDQPHTNKNKSSPTREFDVFLYGHTVFDEKFYMVGIRNKRGERKLLQQTMTNDFQKARDSLMEWKDFLNKS